MKYNAFMLIKNVSKVFEVKNLASAIKALYRGEAVAIKELNGTVVQLPQLPAYKPLPKVATTRLMKLQQIELERYNLKITEQRKQIITEIRSKYAQDAYNEQLFVKGQYAKQEVTKTKLLKALAQLRLDGLTSTQEFIELGINFNAQIKALINNSPISLLEIMYNELAPAYGFQQGSFTWDTDIEHSFESSTRETVEYAGTQHIIWTEEYYYEADSKTSYITDAVKFDGLRANNRTTVNPKDVILVLYYQMLFDKGVLPLDKGYYICECGHTLRAINRVNTDNVVTVSEDDESNYNALNCKKRKHYLDDVEDEEDIEDIIKDNEDIYCPYCDRRRKFIEEV